MKKLSFLLAFVLLFSFCLGACGQPTGGSLQMGGNLLEISMDSAPFAVTCALDYFVILGQKGSLVPDYTVPQTFEQYAKGEDPEIQYLYDNLL